jgi:hypothetical protein
LVTTFSKHTEWKFEVLRKHGIILDKKIIEDTITKPALLLRGMKETMIAQKVLDETHLLRVIHTRKDNDIRVITFYLARREHMKIRYDQEDDILTYEVSDDPIDYAEEMGQVIVHFTKDSKPVLLEILNAEEFLSKALKIGKKKKGR